jgi:hypothetical protein
VQNPNDYKMNYINYNNQLDELFKDWKAASEKNGHRTFCYDGLMYKGEVSNKQWNIKEKGDENELWYNAPKRVLFLLKDMNNSGSTDEQDVREWHCHAHDGYLNTIAYKNMAYWLYGLLNIEANGNAPKFDALTLEMITDFFDKTPFAYVNCKKEAGVSEIGNDILVTHIKLYKDYIKKEIEILAPDIIVCCGGSSMLKNFVAENIYTDLKKINNWVYYDTVHDKVVIDSYHPSYWQIEGGSKTIYDDMMSAYKVFLDKYPNFLKNKRKTLEAVREGIKKNTMGIFKKNALEIVSKELTTEFGKKLQIKNCEYEDGRKYVQFWFEPYDKWVEVWDGDKLQLWLASKKKYDNGIEISGILFSNREWNNSGKHHWYKADEHFEFDPKDEAEVSALIADAIAVLNNLIIFCG